MEFKYKLETGGGGGILNVKKKKRERLWCCPWASYLKFKVGQLSISLHWASFHRNCIQYPSTSPQTGILSNLNFKADWSTIYILSTQNSYIFFSPLHRTLSPAIQRSPKVHPVTECGLHAQKTTHLPITSTLYICEETAIKKKNPAWKKGAWKIHSRIQSVSHIRINICLN